jgi:hypothetical protein
MKSFIARAYLLVLALCQAGKSAQSDADIGTSVYDLFGKHCLGWIPCQAAHALGSEAPPYLFKLLGGPSQKAVLGHYHSHYRPYCVRHG